MTRGFPDLLPSSTMRGVLSARLARPALRFSQACTPSAAQQARGTAQTAAEPEEVGVGAAGSPWGQERVTPDGRLVLPHNPAAPGAPTPAAAAASAAAARGERGGVGAASHRPGLPPAVPLVPPPSEAQLAALVDFLQSARNVLVITGAGASTESGVPDYRGPRGAYSTGFKPMTHQKFMRGPAQQSRYWARSFAGWYEFSSVPHNAAHEGIAALQARGWVGDIITQNVDRLHQRAGSRGVLELHGTTHEVVCMGCGTLSCRHEFQSQLAQLNPEAESAARALAAAPGSAAARYQRGLRAPGIDDDAAAAAAAAAAREDAGEAPVARRPDGDVELQRGAEADFVVPPCGRCGGVLKPHVVFFGDGVPRERADRALHLASTCDALLVVGSSLMVYSAFRLAKAAHASGAAIAVVTAGPTRADDFIDLKVECLAGEVLARLARHPALLLPRVA